MHGEEKRLLSHVLNLSFPGIDSEALIVALKPYISISNGSACTSASYKASHVLEAMRLRPDDIAGAIRLSWCHLTPELDWEPVKDAIKELKPS